MTNLDYEDVDDPVDDLASYWKALDKGKKVAAVMTKSTGIVGAAPSAIIVQNYAGHDGLGKFQL